MRWGLLVVAALAPPSRRALAQDSSRALPAVMYVGSEEENYLRYLQTLGAVPAYPWSMRGFSGEDLGRLVPRTTAHPWAAWPGLQARAKHHRRFSAELTPTSASLTYNTLFPFGFNDGATWAGRGATIALQGGGSLRFGPLKIVLAPNAFWSQNRSFELAVYDTSGSPYGSAVAPGAVDWPQRFGDNAYARLDPGQSSLELSGFGLRAGASTANLWWGPMSEFPYVMGNNAPGFPHIFLGTASPRNLLIGRLHTTIIFGRLSQSAYSPVTTGSLDRFGSGLVAVFEPSWMPGLELGTARFFHVAWPDSGSPSAEYYQHLFEGFIKKRIRKVFVPDGPSNQSADNQLASVFARWVFPNSGFEAYAEYGREDHNWDTRDLIVEPDHSAGFGYGVRKAYQVAGHIRAVRLEVMTYQPSALGRHRAEFGAYHHGATRQGHTQLGQLLATGIAATSGAAAGLTYETVEPQCTTRWMWYRLVTLDRGLPVPVPADAQHVLGIEREVLRGTSTLRARTLVIANFNRGFTTQDVLSLQLDFGWQRF